MKIKKSKRENKAIFKKLSAAAVILLGFSLLAAACGSDSDDDSGSNASSGSGGTLQRVRDRDKVVCGSRSDLTGYASLDSDGRSVGFDADFCRVIAAAVLGDADKVEFKLLQTADRFTALQSGEIDVLVRNTTWTATRDGAEGANFLFTTFYDGQGFMVPASSGITTIDDMQNTDICVASGTTTELNLTAFLDQQGISFNPRTFDDNTTLRSAYEAGQCQVWTTDKSGLVSQKRDIESSGGGDQFILPDTISKEPLGPAVPDGDTEWAQVVNWAVMSTVQGWEFGLTSSNVNNYSGDDKNIKNFLGQNEIDVRLGLSDDFALNVISQVGNYKEIYDRNLTPLGLALEGSPNDLWTNGGLMYVPPYR